MAAERTDNEVRFSKQVQCTALEMPRSGFFLIKNILTNKEEK